MFKRNRSKITDKELLDMYVEFVADAEDKINRLSEVIDRYRELADTRESFLARRILADLEAVIINA